MRAHGRQLSRGSEAEDEEKSKEGKDAAFNLLLSTEKFIHHLEGTSQKGHRNSLGLDMHTLNDYKGTGTSDDRIPLSGNGETTISPRGNKVHHPHSTPSFSLKQPSIRVSCARQSTRILRKPLQALFHQTQSSSYMGLKDL